MGCIYLLALFFCVLSAITCTNFEGDSRIVIGTSVKELGKSLNKAAKDIKKESYDTVIVLGYSKDEKLSTDVREALTDVSYNAYTDADLPGLLIVTKQKLSTVPGRPLLWNRTYESSHGFYEHMGGRLIKDKTERAEALEAVKSLMWETFKKITFGKEVSIQGVSLIGTNEDFSLLIWKGCQYVVSSGYTLFKDTDVRFVKGTLPTAPSALPGTKGGCFWVKYKAYLVTGGIILGVVFVAALGIYFWRSR